MEHAQEPRKPLSGRALGLVLIFLTAIIWVAASFISQLLVNTEEGKPSYNVSPFLLTYLSTSIFTVFLPLVQLKNLLQETRLLRRSFKYKPLQQQDAADEEEEQLPLASSAAQQQQQHGRQQQTAAAAAPGSLEADLDLAEAAAAAEQASAVARASAVAHKESFIAAAQCFMFWFIAQYLFNLSLSMTSVTSNTILSSSSSLFTFALSMVVLKEPWSCAKLLSIAACMGGTLLVTLSDNHSGSSSGGGSSSSNVAAMGGNSIHSLAGGAAFNSSAAAALNSTLAAAAAAAALNGTAPVTPASAGSGASHSVTGDLLCLTSACFYACYTIVLRKSLPDDDEANVALFFGYVGVLCSVVFAPVVAILAGLGSMHLKSIPPKAYLIILIEGILNYCLSDYLWAHAVLLLGPTIATLGLSVQIPVAAAVEVLMGTPKWLSSSSSIAMTLSGTGLIMAGFFAGNLAGGGSVVGSHHRGDLESGGSSTEQQCRQPNGGFEYSADDLNPGDAGQHNRSTSAAAAGAAAEGPVIMPVSRHASIRERSPPRAGSSGSRTPRQRQQQQQQWQQSDGWLADEDLGLLGLGSTDGDGMSGQQQQLQQHLHQQRRLSIEMSSLPSSTPNSSRSSGSPPSQQQQQLQEADAAAAGVGCSEGSAGGCGGQNSPSVGEAGQLGATEGASDGDSEGGGGNLSRLQKPRKTSRLQKAST